MVAASVLEGQVKWCEGLVSPSVHSYREWQGRWLTPELEQYFSDAEAATTPAPRVSFARPS